MSRQLDLFDRKKPDTFENYHHKRILFSLEERMAIEYMCSKPDLSIAEMARRIGRSKNGITSEIRNNGGRENYKGKEAHKNSEIRSLERNQKVSEGLKRLASQGINPASREQALRARVEGLEEYVKLLQEQIEEINDRIKNN